MSLRASQASSVDTLTSTLQPTSTAVRFTLQSSLTLSRVLLLSDRRKSVTRSRLRQRLLTSGFVRTVLQRPTVSRVLQSTSSLASSANRTASPTSVRLFTSTWTRRAKSPCQPFPSLNPRHLSLCPAVLGWALSSSSISPVMFISPRRVTPCPSTLPPPFPAVLGWGAVPSLRLNH